jgi:hypothetical protein
MIGRVTNMGGNQAGKPGLEVSTRLLGSHIQFRDGSTTRLDANHIAKKLFREGRTGTIHDLSDMLSGYYRQPGTTPEALVGAAAAAEAPGAFSFRANEGMKDVERIDFEVEFTVRSRT